VARTLAGILAFECGDDVLRDLAIVSVKPAPNSARLLVTFTLPPGRNSAETDLIAERLDSARPMLRCQVAAAIHRRKVPDLLFRFDG
jgi:ribosome-binding factor A